VEPEAGLLHQITDHIGGESPSWCPTVRNTVRNSHPRRAHHTLAKLIRHRRADLQHRDRRGPVHRVRLHEAKATARLDPLLPTITAICRDQRQPRGPCVRQLSGICRWLGSS